MQSPRNPLIGYLLPLAAVLACLQGCTVTPDTVSVVRDADTDMFAGERMVVVVTRYRNEGIDAAELKSIEQTLEQCVRIRMQEIRDIFAFLPPDDFREMVPEKALGATGSLSPTARVRELAAPAVAVRLTEARLRYVVLLDASYATSPSEWGVASSQGGIAVGRQWRQDSVIQATILDLKHARIAGSIRVRSVGQEGAGLGLIYIIPFPYYYNTLPESGNCAALGKELAEFLTRGIDGGAPRP